MTWDEVCANRDPQNLPFRIETNRWGQIVMSPPHHDHSFAQAFKAGAREVWIREHWGGMLFFNAAGSMERSELCPGFPSAVKI